MNRRNGRVLTRHRLREEAEEAGREMARTLRVEHVIHPEDGGVAEAAPRRGASGASTEQL